MTIATTQGYHRPSYIRRMPRWHDGVGRLMDLGVTFDLILRGEGDAQPLAEDWVLVADDLRRVAARLTPES